MSDDTSPLANMLKMVDEAAELLNLDTNIHQMLRKPHRSLFVSVGIGAEALVPPQ